MNKTCIFCNSLAPKDHLGHNNGLCVAYSSFWKIDNNISNLIWDAFSDYTPEKHAEIDKIIQKFWRENNKESNKGINNNFNKIDKNIQRLEDLTFSLEKLLIDG